MDKGQREEVKKRKKKRTLKEDRDDPRHLGLNEEYPVKSSEE